MFMADKNGEMKKINNKRVASANNFINKSGALVTQAIVIAIYPTSPDKNTRPGKIK